MKTITFNNDALVMALDIKRKATNLDWAGVANESGVSASTICRIRTGEKTRTQIPWRGLFTGAVWILAT